MTFAALLAHPGVDEVCVRRGRFGFMAYHGGSLEEMTDVIAAAAAEQSNASYYGVHQPPDLQWHIPSIDVTPAASTELAWFLDHVDVVVTVHGYGRQGLWTTLLLGGGNRTLADHVGGHLRAALPAYEIATDLERIPKELCGLHPEPGEPSDRRWGATRAPTARARFEPAVGRLGRARAGSAHRRPHRGLGGGRSQLGRYGLRRSTIQPSPDRR